MAAISMSSVFCVQSTNYRAVSCAALQGLYGAGCRFIGSIECQIYEADDEGEHSSLVVPSPWVLEKPAREIVREELQLLSRNLPQNCALSARFLAPFPSGEERVSMQLRPADDLSCMVILWGDYEALLERVPSSVAEQNMDYYRVLGTYLYQEIHPIYGVQQPFHSGSGLRELINQEYELPLDWAFYGPQIVDILHLKNSQCFEQAKQVDWLYDGGVFFAFDEWMNYSFDPQTASLTQALRNQIKQWGQWSALLPGEKASH